MYWPNREILPKIQLLKTVTSTSVFSPKCRRITNYAITQAFSQYLWHRGPNPSFVVLGFFIIHCICFKIPFTVSKYLVSNWSYTRLIRTVKKWYNWIKSSWFFMSSQSLLHYSEISLGHKGLYAVSNKTNGIKIGLQLYNLWEIHGQQLNWRIANSNTPLPFGPLAQYPESDKRQILSPSVTFGSSEESVLLTM